MPADSQTTITVTEETEQTLKEVMEEHEFEDLSETVAYTANLAQDPEALSETEVGQLLITKLTK